MADALRDHAVRVHESATARDPAVTVRLARTEMVVVLDHATQQALKRLPLPSPARIVVLADTGDWSEHYAASVPEFERVWATEPEPHRSTLRTCALVGWALTHVPDDANVAPPIDSLVTACDDH